MKKIILMTLVCPLLSFSQNSRYSLKLFNSMNYFTTQNFASSFSFPGETKNFEFLKIVPGFSIKNNKTETDFIINYANLGKSNILLTTFIDSQTSILTKVKSSYFTLGFSIFRYWYLKSSKNEKIDYSIGGSIDPLYSNYITTPEIGLKTKSSQLKMELNFVPKMSYFINETISFDVNIPLTLVQIQNNYSRVYNNGLTRNQQINNLSEFNILPSQLRLNLGLSIKIK